MVLHLLNPDFMPLTIFMVLAIMGAIRGLLFLEDEEEADEGMLTGRGRAAPTPTGAPAGRAVPCLAWALATFLGGLALSPT